ncbi:MAG: pitrilysin family protein [Bdellovibrionaceae bacterium]|nr:pitrilysin family protein [Pseudobdellovibrionaceae bacterium]
MKRKYIVLFLMTVLFMTLNSCNSWRSSNYKEIKVKSGSKILFFKDDSLPYIQFSIMFPKAGSDYDLKDKSGLAQLTAYLLDQGAGGLSSEKLQEELNKLGTEFSVEVGRQMAYFSIKGLSWHQEKLYNLFKKIISRPNFESSEMEILRKQFIERRANNLDESDFVANTILRNTLFKGPSAKSSIGNLLSLSKIKLEDIKNFYKKHYIKGNPILMIIGNFDKNIKKSAVSFMNKNFSHEDEDSHSITLPDLKAQIKLVTNEDLVQAEVRLAYKLFPFPTKNPRQFLIFRLANTILGSGSMTSRLFDELREKRGLTYSAHSSVNMGKLYGFFDISGGTKTSSVKEFLKQSLIILNKLKKEGVTPKELNTAKQLTKIYFLVRTETPADKLYQTVYYNYYLGLDSNFLDNYTKTIDDISLEEVNKGIKEFILLNPLQIIIYGHPSIKSQLKDMKNFTLSTVSFKDYFKKELDLIPALSQSK